VGLQFTIHLCRGNQRSMCIAKGLRRARERLFNELRTSAFCWNMIPRAAASSHCFVPKGSRRARGLISTKVPELESVDDLNADRRPPQVCGLDQLALSPAVRVASMWWETYQ